MRPRNREGRARKSLIFGALCVVVSFAASAQTASTPPSYGGWTESPYRNFGPPHSLLGGRAVLVDEGDDPTLRALLSTEISRLFNDLYVRQGWRSPFADGDPLRIFVARKEADGVRRVAARSVEGGRLVAAAILLDSRGLTAREIVREVSRQIALATLAGYRVADGTFVTEAAAALISSGADDGDRDAARLAAAAPELSIEANPSVLGRLYLEELTRDAGPGLLRTAWERAAESGQPILPELLGTYVERTGEAEDRPLVRFAARLYTTVESEVAPSRVGLVDLEAGALDAAAPAGFTLRHRTYVPGDGASALKVSWPEDGGSGAAIVRYRDAALPPDVVFLSARDIRSIPLGGVARVDWVVAGGFPGGALRAPAAIESSATFPYSGLTAHAAAGPDGPRVAWTTASHEGLAGWVVFREEVLPDGRIARTGPEIIPSSRSAQESFAYAYLDPAANAGTFYRYTIWAVTEDGLLSRAFSVTLRSAD
ncbi:MAG TPA: hypothetical protein VGQ75_10655 [Thermoanaerobaculia bacterium]|jgi:hypothetical protein|nr:hypothetical protein [Thermoanaerobaculia bacterium]